MTAAIVFEMSRNPIIYLAPGGRNGDTHLVWANRDTSPIIHPAGQLWERVAEPSVC